MTVAIALTCLILFIVVYLIAMYIENEYTLQVGDRVEFQLDYESLLTKYEVQGKRGTIDKIDKNGVGWTQFHVQLDDGSRAMFNWIHRGNVTRIGGGRKKKND